MNIFIGMLHNFVQAIFVLRNIYRLRNIYKKTIFATFDLTCSVIETILWAKAYILSEFAPPKKIKSWIRHCTYTKNLINWIVEQPCFQMKQWIVLNKSRMKAVYVLLLSYAPEEFIFFYFLELFCFYCAILPKLLRPYFFLTVVTWWINWFT